MVTLKLLSRKEACFVFLSTPAVVRVKEHCANPSLVSVHTQQTTRPDTRSVVGVVAAAAQSSLSPL